MNLPTLIFIAVAIPFTVVALLWAFAQYLGWLAPRPKARGWMYGTVGLLYLVVSIWELMGEEMQLGLELGLRIILGVIFIAMGFHEYRHGASVPID